MAVLQAGPVRYETRTHPFTARSNIPPSGFPWKKRTFLRIRVECERNYF